MGAAAQLVYRIVLWLSANSRVGMQAMDVKRLIYVVPLTIGFIVYFRGEEGRLVRHLGALGYTDIQIEHPTRYHCAGRWGTYSYRARSPAGVPVRGGACVFFIIYELTEPLRS